MGELRYPEVRRNLEARHGVGEFVAIKRSPHQTGRLFTTAKTIAAEHEILRRMLKGQNELEPVLHRHNAIAFADAQPHLNLAQKAVVEDVLSSGDRIHGIQGVAGGGKTTALAVIRTAAEAQNYRVEGFAPTSRAAKQLEQAGVHSGTLQSFLMRSPDSDTQQRKLFFVDESSLASTNQMREFLRRLGPVDRVLLIGDTRQHQGVEAGRPFQQLQEAGMPTSKLDQIVRQKDPVLKGEVELLANGKAAAAIESLRNRGKVNEISDPLERIRAIAENYVAKPLGTLIVSPDNKSRHQLNQAVRQELRTKGLVGADDHTFRVLLPRQDMTGAERAWARRYEPENVVRFSRGSKVLGIEAGSYGRVVDVNVGENLLTIQKANGNQIIYDPKRLSGVTVYESAKREFSVGDRIQFTAPQKQLGVANRELGNIEKIAPDGGISVSLEDGRNIGFNAALHPHFDHGYAVTSHSAQGLTSDRVLINGDTATHPELLNARFAYVSVSRARLDAEIYTNDLSGLSKKLSAETEKSSAIEVCGSFEISRVAHSSLGQDI
jgi:ATP-dependent exoDNAse (exonuclease V) alpha subunit